MPPLPVSLQLKPGVDIQSTALQTGASISECNLIRTKQGQTQKLGGCARMTSQTIAGIGRALFAWADASLNTYLAIGTSGALEVMNNGVISNITPVALAVHTSNLSSPCFQTVSGSPNVTVTDAGFNPVAGQLFWIVNATYIGGLFLQGLYQVATVPSGTTFTFKAGSNATGSSTASSTLNFTTTNGSAAVTLTLGAYSFTNGQALLVGVSTAVGGVTLFDGYTVTVTGGPVNTITAGGLAGSSTSGHENGDQTRIRYLPAESAPAGAYGTGLYGLGPYGIGVGSGAVVITEWWFDKWGSPAILIAAIAGGTIYEWAPPVVPGNYAVAVSNAPTAVNGVLVATPEQQIVAWGAFSGSLGELDPLLVAWCDVANRTVWTASATNQAGSFRLSSGSEILAIAKFGLLMLIWTDVDVWAMQYLGFPLVYSFNQIAPNCGLLAPRAWAVLGTIAAWLEENDFFVYRGGSAAVLPCGVRDFIFGNIDRQYRLAIHADANTWFGEITWWFPTVGSLGVCNCYVRWNAIEDVWDYGGTPGAVTSMPSVPQVSAWVDHQEPFGSPVGTDYNALVQQFEVSLDYDMGTAPQPDSWIKSGWLQISEGEEVAFLERVRWDINWAGSTAATPTIYGFLNFADELPTDNANIPVRRYGPYTITPQVAYSIVRGRGRFCSVEVHSNPGGVPFVPGTAWRYGKPLPTITQDGRR